jgi:RNA cap guanine-N2 methyltransferase
MRGAAEREVAVEVDPVPAWIDARRLLGEYAWQLTPLADGRGLCARAALPALAAAELASRLRGLGLDGAPLRVSIVPAPGRALVRAARLAEARARRSSTAGFSLRAARATGEGRFSLTPEALALALAAHARGQRVVDACCGSGGNALGFARAGCAVTAIDAEPARIAEARHNAGLYGVAERIRFLTGDARQLVPELEADILFIDPPWGDAAGRYDKRRTDRSSLPLLDQLLDLPLTGYRELWLKLPCSFDTRSIPGGRPRAWFGEATGDRRRVKFVELVVETRPRGRER